MVKVSFAKSNRFVYRQRRSFTLASVFVLLVLTSGVLFAQEYNFRNFGVTEGLNNLAVRQIYQDRVGFIWVSTENGIFRYDGERFEAFGPEQGIPSTSGAAFGDAPDGSLLVGGDFGLYQLSGNRFEKLPVVFKTVSWAQGIQSDGKGHTFIGTDSGLVELYSEPGQDGFAVRRFPQAPGTSGPGAYGVSVDGDILWYGCGEELCRMDRDRTTVFGRDSGLPDRVWLGIQKDRDGNLWVRAKNAGVFVLPVGQTRFRRPDAPIPGSEMGLVATDAEGRILLPSPDGLLIRDEKGWQKIDRSVGLRGVVYAAFEDRQHSLWIGLAGRGLAEWRGYREWESYSTASGLPSDIVYEILPRADGSLWVATEGGLFRGTRRQFGISWKKVAGLVGFPVHSLQMAPAGDLWIGTETRGAARIDARTGGVQWFGQKQGLSGKAAYTLRFDREQRLWAATEEGLFVARAPYQKFSRITELPSTRIWAIAEGTDGTIWAGGAGGLFGHSDGHWKNWTRADGLSNQEVLSLGCRCGWHHVDRLSPRGRHRPYPSAAWRHSYRESCSKTRQRRTRVFPGIRCIGAAVGGDRAGRGHVGWFPLEPLRYQGRFGVGRLQPERVRRGGRWHSLDRNKRWTLSFQAASAPRARSTARGRFHEACHGTDGCFRAAQPILRRFIQTLSSQDTPRRMLPVQNGVVFRYRLKGANSTWTETAQRELQFAELAPGAYRLEIEARDSDGVWSGHRAEFPFEILTPWYWTWWFVGTCGLIPLSVVLGLLRLRMLAAQRREQRTPADGGRENSGSAAGQ